MTHNATNDDNPSATAARQAWMAVLARASVAQLEAMRQDMGDLAQVQVVRPPEVGMVMLRGRIGGTGNPFNQGEASVVRCAVRLGDGPLGIAYALGRDKRRAELAALFDALLQTPQYHQRVLNGLIEPLAHTQSAVRQKQGQDVAGSKVEFFTFVRGAA